MEVDGLRLSCATIQMSYRLFRTRKSVISGRRLGRNDTFYCSFLADSLILGGQSHVLSNLLRLLVFAELSISVDLLLHLLHAGLALFECILSLGGRVKEALAHRVCRCFHRL